MEKRKENRSAAEETNYDLSNMGDAGSLAPIANGKAGESRNQPESKSEMKDPESDTKSDSVKDQDEKYSLAVEILNMAISLLSGRTSPDELKSLLDAAQIDKAIEAARAEGEIAGRNAAIEEQMMPTPVGAPDLHGTPDLSHRNSSSIFDLALKAK